MDPIDKLYASLRLLQSVVERLTQDGAPQLLLDDLNAVLALGDEVLAELVADRERSVQRKCLDSLSPGCGSLPINQTEH